jgi:hypothetical protein
MAVAWSAPIMSQMMMTLLDMVAISGLQVPDRVWRSGLRGVINSKRVGLRR